MQNRKKAECVRVDLWIPKAILEGLEDIYGPRKKTTNILEALEVFLEHQKTRY